MYIRDAALTWNILDLGTYNGKPVYDVFYGIGRFVISFYYIGGVLLNCIFIVWAFYYRKWYFLILLSFFIALWIGARVLDIYNMRMIFPEYTIFYF